MEELYKELSEQNERFNLQMFQYNKMVLRIESIIEELTKLKIPMTEFKNHSVGGDFKPLSNLRPKMGVEDLYKLANEEFNTYGTEISINGFYTKDKDEWIQQRDIKSIRSAIAKYIKDTKRTDIKPKMLCIYEHASKYHFHGIFRGIPNDCVDYIRKFCTRRCGRTEIKAISKQHNYIQYMFKSYIPECAKEHKIDILEHFDDYDYFTIGL